MLPRIEDKTLEDLEIPYPYSLAVFLMVAMTIHEGHTLGVIHRDIKPANIFLTPSGPLVFDYGLAYIRGQPDLPVEQDYYLGTPTVTPPELLVEDIDPEPEQDYYQLGVLLHCLIENDYPVPGRSPSEMLANTTRGIRAPTRPEIQEIRDLLMDQRDFATAITLGSELLTRDTVGDDISLG